MRDSRILSRALLAVTVIAACGDHEASTAPKPGVGPVDASFVKPSRTECKISYTLALGDGNPISSDNGTPYVNKVQNVLVATGVFEGMRFDTDGSNQIDQSSTRKVRLDFSGTPFEGGANALKSIDLRFDNQNEPLNMCYGVANVADQRSVSALLNFTSSVGGRPASLQYGGIRPGASDSCQDDYGVSKLTVTRTKKRGVNGSTTDEWDVVSGATACLYYSIGGAWVYQGTVAMPIHFTLTALGPVP
jgi:hypothetical protein